MRVRRLVLPVVVVGALGGWLGGRALLAEHHLQHARTGLGDARTALLDSRVDDASAALRAAGRDTAAARRLTADPVWGAAAAVPVLGRSLRTVRGLTVAADDLTGQVLPPAVQAARGLLGQGLRRPDGAVDLAGLRATEPALARTATGLRAVESRLAALPGGPGPVGAARTELHSRVGELAQAVDQAQRAVQLAPALLGGDRPRRYFVLVQQPGESRGTGGLTGGYAVVEADGGRLTVTRSGSNADLRNGAVPVPTGVSDQYAYEYGGNLAFSDWRDVNLSPDLPSVARVVAARWQAQSGQVVDGVVALDPTAIADLVRGSGPVDVGDRRVATTQLVRYLTVDQYAGLPITAQGARKDALAAVAAQIAGRLTGAAGDPRALLPGLVTAVRSGHLRMASDDPALQPALARSGVDGALPAGDAPVAYAVVQNATQGKLDTFLDRAVTYTAGACTGGSRPSTIRVELRNDAPAEGLPAYLTIRDEDGRTTASTDSAVVLQTYGSRGATLVAADLDGQPLVASGMRGADLHEGLEAGLPFWGLRVELPRGLPRVLTLHLLEPVAAGVARVPEQPLVRPLRRSVDLPTCS